MEALHFVLPLTCCFSSLCLTVAASHDAQRRRRCATARPALAAAESSGAGLADPYLRLQVWGGTLTSLTQLLTLMPHADVDGVWTSELEGRWMIASMAAYLVPLVLLPLAAPRFFHRRRHAVMVGFWLFFFSLPNICGRRASSFALKDPPSLRRLGFLKDIFIITLGTRTLALALLGTFAPLPPLQHLGVAVWALYRIAMPDSRAHHVCALPFMQRPGWRARVALFHRAMHVALLSEPGRVGLDPDADCRRFVTCYQLLAGLLLPAVVGSRFVDLSARRAPARRGGAWARAAAAAGALPRAAEGALQRLYDVLSGRGSSGGARAAAWWLVLHIVYAAALWWEHSQPAAPPAGACAAPLAA